VSLSYSRTPCEFLDPQILLQLSAYHTGHVNGDVVQEADAVVSPPESSGSSAFCVHAVSNDETIIREI